MQHWAAVLLLGVVAVRFSTDSSGSNRDGEMARSEESLDESVGGANEYGTDVCQAGIHYFLHYSRNCQKMVHPALKERNGCFLPDFVNFEASTGNQADEVHWLGGAPHNGLYRATEGDDSGWTCSKVAKMKIPDYCSRAIVSELSGVYDNHHRFSAIMAGARVLHQDSKFQCTGTSRLERMIRRKLDTSRATATPRKNVEESNSSSTIAHVLQPKRQSKACWNFVNDYRQLYCHRYSHCECTGDECLGDEKVQCCRDAYQEYVESQEFPDDFAPEVTRQLFRKDSPMMKTGSWLQAPVTTQSDAAALSAVIALRLQKVPVRNGMIPMEDFPLWRMALKGQRDNTPGMENIPLSLHKLGIGHVLDGFTTTTVLTVKLPALGKAKRSGRFDQYGDQEGLNYLFMLGIKAVVLSSGASWIPVGHVVKGGVADQNGIRKGDLIVSVDGRRGSSGKLSALLGAIGQNDMTMLEVERGDFGGLMERLGDEGAFEAGYLSRYTKKYSIPTRGAFSGLFFEADPKPQKVTRDLEAILQQAFRLPTPRGVSRAIERAGSSFKSLITPRPAQPEKSAAEQRAEQRADRVHAEKSTSPSLYREERINAMVVKEVTGMAQAMQLAIRPGDYVVSVNEQTGAAGMKYMMQMGAALPRGTLDVVVVAGGMKASIDAIVKQTSADCPTCVASRAGVTTAIIPRA